MAFVPIGLNLLAENLDRSEVVALLATWLIVLSQLNAIKDDPSDSITGVARDVNKSLVIAS